MPGSDVSASRYTSPLSVEVPAGWTVSEVLNLVAPSGMRVRLRRDGAAPGVTAPQLTKTQLEQTSQVVESLTELGDSTTVVFDGRRAHSRDFSYSAEGRQFTATVMSVIADGAAIVASASWPSEAPPASEELAAARGLLSSVSTTPSGELASGKLTRWSEDELAYMAALSGAIGGFPTVDSHLFAAEESEVSDAVLESVVRSLVARGLLHSDGGSVEPSGDFATVAHLAFSADLVLAIETLGASDNTFVWVGLSDHGALAVEVVDHGARHCWVLPRLDAQRAVLEMSGLAEAMSGSESQDTAGHPATLTLNELLGGSAEVHRLLRIQSGWKESEVNLGGVLTFATSPGRVSLAEPSGADEASWTLKPLDDAAVRDLVASHLPQVFNHD